MKNRLKNWVRRKWPLVWKSSYQKLASQHNRKAKECCQLRKVLEEAYQEIDRLINQIFPTPPCPIHPDACCIEDRALDVYMVVINLRFPTGGLQVNIHRNHVPAVEWYANYIAERVAHEWSKRVQPELAQCIRKEIDSIKGRHEQKASHPISS